MGVDQRGLLVHFCSLMTIHDMNDVKLLKLYSMPNGEQEIGTVCIHVHIHAAGKHLQMCYVTSTAR